MDENSKYQMIVMGASAGGLNAYSQLLPELSGALKQPIIIVQHLFDEAESYLPTHLSRLCHQDVIEPNDKELIRPGKIYVSPPGYHIALDDKKTISLAFDPRVNYSRPSIDVLFESASEHYREHLIAVIMTGANNDGAHGIAQVKRYGGTTIAEDPETAEAPVMPSAAIKTGAVDVILPLKKIASYLNDLLKGERDGET